MRPVCFTRFSQVVAERLPQRLLWAFSPDDLLFADDDVIVACKPAGLSVASSDDNLVSHLHIVQQALGDERPHRSHRSHLCAHVCLDRDTSGAVVFAASKAAGPSLAQQAEERTFEQTFVACVGVRKELPWRGNTKQVNVPVVRDRLGVLRPTRGRSDMLVRAAIRVLARNASRALLEVRTCDGARAVRAVLASAGAIVAGDVVFGSEPAPRLMLHARDLSWRHPISGERITSVAPLPWSFLPWLRGCERVDDLDATTIARAIRECAALRFRLLTQGNVDAIRLVHGEAEGISGLDVELYARVVVAWINEETSDAAAKGVHDGLCALAPAGIYVKRRPKQASRSVGVPSAALDVGIAETGADCARDTSEPFLVSEFGLKYLVQVQQGLGTGLFLDQRENRAWVRQHSNGASVLNLFAYTCSFTLAAAAGGACSTTSVDISKQALGVGARNLANNGLLESCKHRFVCDDVPRWVGRACRASQRFDLIILDPPSFGTSPWGCFSTLKDYRHLAASSMELLHDRGWLLACTNHRAVGEAKLRDWLRSAAHSTGRAVLALEEARAGQDFPVPQGGEPHMKAFRCQIGHAHR